MTTSNIYTGYNYLTSVVNRDFKIKVFGISNGVKVNRLVGVAGLIQLVGVDLANSLTARAFKDSFKTNIIRCKLRRGLLVSFYLY